METMLLLRRLRLVFVLLLMICVTGVVGYRIMGLSFIDAVYFVVITLTTTGYTEVGGDLEPGWRIFTMFILLSGMGTLLYAISTATAFIVEGELGSLLRKRRIDRAIAKLDRHFILCGLSHIGIYAFWEMHKTRRPVVVIDRSRKALEELSLKTGEDLLYVIGDASADLVLEEAGIAKAQGLITAFEDDMANIYVALSARNLNPDLRIVSRAWDGAATEKLLQAGADSAISTDAIGGRRMVAEFLSPAATTFLDVMLGQKDGVLRIENVVVLDGSNMAGKTLGEARVSERFDLLVMAVRDGHTREFHYNPDPALPLRPGDAVVILGEAQDVERLREYAHPPHGLGVLGIEKPKILTTIRKTAMGD